MQHNENRFYRKLFGEIKKDIGQILRKLCEQKDIEIIEAEACPDHIHMFSHIRLSLLQRTAGDIHMDKRQQAAEYPCRP